MVTTRPRRAVAPYNKRTPSSETPREAAARKHRARQDRLARAALHESQDDGRSVALSWSRPRKSLRVAFSQGVGGIEDDQSDLQARASTLASRSVETSNTVAPAGNTAPASTPTLRRRGRMPYNAFKPSFKSRALNTAWLQREHPDTFAAFEAFSSQHRDSVNFLKGDLPEIIRDDFVNGPWEEVFVTRQDAVHRPWPVNFIRKWIATVDDEGNRVRVVDPHHDYPPLADGYRTAGCCGSVRPSRDLLQR